MRVNPIDGDTLSDGVVTVRDRDSMEQARIPATELRAYLEEARRNWKAPSKAAPAS